jgi:hypothetical protein
MIAIKYSELVAPGHRWCFRAERVAEKASRHGFTESNDMRLICGF